MRVFLVVLAALALGLSTWARADTLHVFPDGTGDYPTIQAAVDAAGDGDTILLGDGVFRGDGNRDIVVYNKAVTIASGSGDPTRAVIDCSGSEADPHWGFEIDSSYPCIIEGITVKNGWKQTPQRGRWGGAVFWRYSHVRLVNCVFAHNRADLGGAVGGGYGGIEIESCTFYGNGAREWGGSIIQDDWGSTTLSHCIIAFGTGGGSARSLCGGVPMQCCNIYGNAGGDYDFFPGQLGVNGNICADPLFCDPARLDLSIAADSPCAPGGECGLMGALPVGCGPTPVEATTWGAIKGLYRAE
ncbi:MAG: hypothetical protein FJY75_06305 [Candidatus Eisenbacteria bacterium]|uniref:Right handed beta helix domain-containing protein n=1 Tax=Eiseniibacteriota bacterium TaxID=2212470 RepID=A0A938BNP7_UNCEI|nr:hypothetical protein [Candidatus Eisenbacteria bacterium]